MCLLAMPVETDSKRIQSCYTQNFHFVIVINTTFDLDLTELPIRKTQTLCICSIVIHSGNMIGNTEVYKTGFMRTLDATLEPASSP